MKILIKTIEDAFNKAGERVSGTSKRGFRWTLYKVNGEYSYFHYGEGDLKIEEGKEYEFDIRENEKGKSISLVRQGYQGNKSAGNGNAIIMEEIISFRKEFNERMNSLAEFLSKKLK